MLTRDGQSGPLVGRICLGAVEVMGVSGAGLSVLVDGQRGPLCVKGVGAEQGENLQLTLGEGPCADAQRTGELVDVADLSTAVDRWPIFVDGMAGHGVSGVGSFALMIGEVRFGALTVYRSEPGLMSNEQVADGLVLAQLAAYAIAAGQARADEGELMAEMEHGFGRLAPVHQATGMLMAHLQVGPTEAFVRLRSRAFAESRSLISLGVDIVERRVAVDPKD